jgi:hypothetical protein
MVVWSLAPGHALATTFYVSSDGEDGAAGTSASAPWRSLARLSRETFHPGDRIFLRRGDVWTGESLSLHGAGTRQEPIGLGAYGHGASPRLWPGGNLPYAVLLGEEAGSDPGGWQFRDLDIGYAQAGLVILNHAASSAGLVVEDCVLHDINGAPFFSRDYMYYSTAIVVHSARDDAAHRLDGLTIARVRIQRADGPLHLLGITHLRIDDLVTDDSPVAGVLFEQVEHGLVRRLRVSRAGSGPGMFWGVAGLQFNGCRDLLVTGSSIVGTRKPPGVPDGVGVDFEGSNEDVTVSRSTIQGSEGSAFLIFRNPDWGVDNVRTNIVDCRLVENGWSDPQRVPAALSHYFNERNGGRIEGNVIVRAAPDQPLNEIDGALAERWPASYRVAANLVLDVPPAARGTRSWPPGLAGPRAPQEGH